MTRADVVIVGAGIAGASLAYELAPHADVLMLEAEAHPGLHATGRSAAFFAETYGGPGVQPLTTASKGFFQSPPPGFAEVPLLRPRGALHVSAGEGGGQLDRLAEEFAGTSVRVERLDAAATREKMPILRSAWEGGALWEPGCSDIDVAALHAAYLKGARRRGARLLTGAALLNACRTGEGWRLETRSDPVKATLLVDAAGAWADEIARLAGVPPLGIVPMRRTVVVAEIDSPVAPGWPLTVDAGGDLYFKPDAGRLWISPHDETPAEAANVQPEELDIAVTADRFEKATTARVRRIERSWAGLRSFAPDRLPVFGPDPQEPGFFWCAGQGGFGIQTSPAAAALSASLILGRPAPEELDAARYAAARLR